MQHGGKRNGAGRPKGSPTRKRRKVTERIMAAATATPLEVILAAMLHYHEAGDRDKAAAFAKEAAPYCHPRLGSLSVQADSTVRVIEDDRWYDNRAHDLVAAGAAPSGAGAP